MAELSKLASFSLVGIAELIVGRLSKIWRRSVCNFGRYRGKTKGGEVGRNILPLPVSRGLPKSFAIDHVLPGFQSVQRLQAADSPTLFCGCLIELSTTSSQSKPLKLIVSSTVSTQYINMPNAPVSSEPVSAVNVLHIQWGHVFCMCSLRDIVF